MRRLQLYACSLLLLATGASGGIVATVDEAVSLIREQASDRVVRATTERLADGAAVYRVRMIDESGRLYSLDVNQQTGEITPSPTPLLVVPRGVAPSDDAAAEDSDPCAS